MSNQEFVNLCKRSIVNYFNRRVDRTDDFVLSENDVYVVWLSKTLQNNKALLSTTVVDGMYYELTFNGDKQELYLDAYKKIENECIVGGEDE